MPSLRCCSPRRCRLRQQRAAVGVERDGAAGAAEQVAAQLGLQRAHLQADGRLGECHALGGGGERPVPRHGHEGAQKTDGAHRLNLKFFLS